MRLLLVILFLFISFPAFAGCDFFGVCRDEPAAKPAKAEKIDAKPEDDMPPQPKPLPALKADINPVAVKPERPQGSIGGPVVYKKVLKTGTVGGAKREPVCEDKGDETFCQ